MTNPWDREVAGNSSPAHSTANSGTERQTLPSISNLTNGVPPLAGSPVSSGHSPSQSSVRTDTRDSGNWSMTTASNHSSFSSPMNLAALTEKHPRSSILNPDHAHELQQARFSGSSHLHHPHQQPGVHGHSPSAMSGHLSNQSTTSLQSTRPQPHVLTSSYAHESSPAASRRSSFDTRLGNLALGSSQGTPAASQVSLVSQLQRERSGGYPQGSPAPSILEHPSHAPTSHAFQTMSPNGHYPTPSISSASTGNRGSLGSWQGPTAANSERPGTRVAPPIVGSARFPYPHPNAPSPTKGFPYAFPDPDVAGASAPSSREGPATANGPTTNAHVGPTSGAINGRTPYAYHQDNGAHQNGVHPQHSQTSLYSQNSNSTTASSHHSHPTFSQGSFQDMHHHSLQRGTSSIGSPAPLTPYSRTPELRISHKLAERKRRKEMKELFDELRDALPAERGGKSSKWEVLTKSIEFLGQIRQINSNLTSRNEDLKSENDQLKAELDRLRNGQPNGHYGVPHGQHYSGGGHHSSNYPSHHMQGMQSRSSAPVHDDHSNQMQGIERSGYRQ